MDPNRDTGVAAHPAKAAIKLQLVRHFQHVSSRSQNGSDREQHGCSAKKIHAIPGMIMRLTLAAHSPLRELILGGVTNYMLAHTDLPVLMRH